MMNSCIIEDCWMKLADMGLRSGPNPWLSHDHVASH